MIIFISIAAVLLLFGFWFLNRPMFGKAPSGERLKRIQQSPQYKDGKFQNFHFTPTLTEGYSMPGLLYQQLFGSFPNRKPNREIPSDKTDLKNLNPNENILVWFGHSSYFLQVDGKKFLIDPVFSGNASPIPGSVKAFPGSNDYQADDFPDIDYLLISHDHYDHLDYKTILELKPKVKTIICGLGVGSHFEHWGFDPAIIIEKDWHETEVLTDTLTIHTTPARHFSGRGLVRNNTLWLSFVLEAKSLKLFLGGDSGYDTHFAEIGKKYGPFDLALIENGQYNLAWEAIHLLPEQFGKAAAELKAKRVFPVHSGKFTLAQHPWDEPLDKVTEYHKTDGYGYSLITPTIGEKVFLDDSNQEFREWWK
ncbi:MBL fold metallo-hydrolase [Flavobacterium wongokense]|uniref:MBL fold metallo-hydrolase n=1 Tax=Flavobacterium wongokense TaxID=2910674 RepID=UPI001F420975|nr:MBL fold metallo-hydrolase [Flavobacterium sp. WG47]MCF6132914.1 MBL fold metallo-hydrolase [Flavobacterium sp. WG47]